MSLSPPRRCAGSVLLSLGLISSIAVESHAHFLFVRIGPVAEGGRSAEVYFSEQARAGDPRFIPKIAHTKLWAQTDPGEFQELKVQAGADRLRSMLPAAVSLGVVGECRYGVLSSRPNQPPFLLRHYPKAVAGAAEAINRLTRRSETPFEIMATIEHERLDQDPTGGDAGPSRIRLVALRNGKPMSGVVFHAVDADLVEVEFTAGAEGAATWTPPAAGHYCFYVGDTLKESGELDGKRYDEVRDFATLSLEWPPGATRPDAEATALFEKATAKRAQWRDFPGFSGEIHGDLDGRAFSGELTIRATGEVTLDVDDDVAIPWLNDQLDSLVMHRLPISKPADPSFTLRFGDDLDEHPLGRLLIVNGGRMASSYRVKDDQISVVNRNLGRQSMTLSVLANEVNAEGLTLPANYVVNYWDGESGRLLRTETFQDRWTRIDRWDLPVSHTVSTSSDGGLSVRTFTISGDAPLKK